MAKFPVEYSDQDSESIVDAVNYVLSGPSGLGQNFSGYNAYTTAYLTGNFRPPFTRPPVSTNALGGSGLTTIQVDDPTGIVSGLSVTGTGIGTGATVSTVSGTTVTLSVANSGPVSGTVNFYTTVPDNLYVAPIALSTAQWIDEYTRKFTFSSAQPTPPFLNGNSITVAGVTPAAYNETFKGPGVVECTTTYVVVKSLNSIANPGAGTGGNAIYRNTIPAPTGSNLPQQNTWIATDCASRVTVNSLTDRVFISAQLSNQISYTVTSTADLQYTVAINRYLGFITNDPVNPDFRFSFDKTICEKVYTESGLTGSGAFNHDTNFSTIIDTPGTGYYLYRIDVQFRIVNTGGAAQVTQSEVDLRSLSVQVVKQ